MLINGIVHVQMFLTLSISRPIPICQTPEQYRNQNAGDIARQCFLRTKAILLITTNLNQKLQLSCALSSTIDIWKNKTNYNITILSAWHIEGSHKGCLGSLLLLLNNRSKTVIVSNSIDYVVATDYSLLLKTQVK